MQKLKLPPLIIVEAPDCCGKTTLAKLLHEKLKYHYIHEGKPPYNGLLYYKDKAVAIKQNFEWYGSRFVLDRFHLGEYVNPIIMNDGRVPLTAQQMADIENLLPNPTILIYPRPSEEFVRKAFVTRGEKVAKLDQIPDLLKMYDAAFEMSSIRHKIRINTEDDPDWQKTVERVQNFDQWVL